MLRGRSTGSKCDTTISHWGARDMWFVYDDTNPCSLPVIWAQYEIKYPCPPEERKVWAMASPSSDRGVRPQEIVHPRARRSRGQADHSARSSRHARATGIMAQPDGDEATAQALVRHKTVDALRTYYKMLPSKYADM
eukprot:6037982-Prymnesium_polylepis.1